MSAPDVCALCAASLRLYADDAGCVQGWLCPECDGEHARELQQVSADRVLCYVCKSREPERRGRCAGCAHA